MLSFTSISLNRVKVEFLSIPVCEDADLHTDPEIQQLIAKAKTLEEFKGEKNQQVVLYDLAKGNVRRCIFIGLGPQKELNAETLRAFSGCALKKAMGLKVKEIFLAAPLAQNLPVPLPEALKAMLEGARLANHAFNRYKQKPKNNLLKKISLLLPPALARQHKSLLTQVEAVCQATLKARDWINTPANDKFPQHLAQQFGQALKGSSVKVRVMDAAQLKSRKFNALLAVAAGSPHPPCLVEMSYTPAKAKRTIVLVGKGVTFDTGGIDLKPPAGMEAMKGDMAGAAAVAGAMLAIARLKPGLRVIGLAPIVENMLSGSAMRPGDIVTSYAGKTVEINNTDAEGRLILIDTLAYAIEKHKPDVLIDLATLTGACVVALGDKIAGLFSPDKALSKTIVQAGQAVFERCWLMPMPADYKELLKSDLADISNMPSTRNGGAISAALFLSEFVGDTRWAHIDIAGPAHAKKGSDYCAAGATGFGVRLLCEVIDKLKDKISSRKT